MLSGGWRCPSAIVTSGPGQDRLEDVSMAEAGLGET
jgi:hypothetical protein